MDVRAQIKVRGVVQGVGFRPFVYMQANRRKLRGRVLNNETGVLIDVEGTTSAIKDFLHEITTNPPPLSKIESVEYSPKPSQASYRDFSIVASRAVGETFVPISADIATCNDCLRELFDPMDRRYRYPFINCTNCGPRFTILEDVPYDREKTTMRDFDMCAACRAEYENPLDRRFHAEPIACRRCGPQIHLLDATGSEAHLFRKRDILEHSRRLLLNGKILAIKGVGGFHLACDALSREAVERLRAGKYREDKPFALMAPSVDVIKTECFTSEAEEALLASEARPIVLLKRKPGSKIPPAVAPGIGTLGFMLPYTPLHWLLLEDLDRPLVMTSNISDEPICYEDRDATQRLAGIADYFLVHNRRIHMRADDSVTRVQQGCATVLRRSRGYAPAPIQTAFRFKRQILACGAELKNTFCLTRENYAFISHHIGDLENLETLRSFSAGIEHFTRLFNLEPKVVAYDLHPEYLSTKYARGLDEIQIKIAVQHHHAHIASCMADNGVDGEVIGVAMDGLGFGGDGKLWGGEFFVADFVNAERIAHLAYVPLPGGEKAIREPWRMAAVYLQQAFGDHFLDLNLPLVNKLNRRDWTTMQNMIATETNCPLTSSMGRLFDAVSSLLGVRDSINYEGQPAIELEALASADVSQHYEFDVGADGVIRAEPLIRKAVGDLLEGCSREHVAAQFHNSVAHLILSVAEQVRGRQKLNRVVLSGGVFQNLFLLERVCKLLNESGFEVLTHRRVPANDGGISLGQAAVANARLELEED